MSDEQQCSGTGNPFVFPVPAIEGHVAKPGLRLRDAAMLAVLPALISKYSMDEREDRGVDDLVTAAWNIATRACDRR